MSAAAESDPSTHAPTATQNTVANDCAGAIVEATPAAIKDATTGAAEAEPIVRTTLLSPIAAAVSFAGDHLATNWAQMA